MNIFDGLAKVGFIDLGFAPWKSGEGLQIQNLEKLNDEAPGVYVMHYEGVIYKVGKSSASLRRRLTGYRRFDRDYLACPEQGRDKSSQKQRSAIKEFSLPGLSVLALQAKLSTDNIPILGIEVKMTSFDPHDYEKKLIDILKDKHPLKFGR
jgi:hypothetical protein